MGNFVKPEVYLIAETQIVPEGLHEALTALGVPGWETDAASDAEKLMEFAGKSCYLSFSTDLNKNLTKVGTRNNQDYLQQGIIATGHGSVLEHASVTFFFLNVSRVLTHELVRHRPGMAFSQVSGRYVRTDEINMYLPGIIEEEPRAVELFRRAQGMMESWVLELEDIFGINEMKDFSRKKKLTSAFRRLIGNGQANHITVSGNHRAWRHQLVARTSRHAEEEIRLAYGLLFDQLVSRYPAVYADHHIEWVDGFREITFDQPKV